MSLKKAFSNDNKICTVTFDVSAEAANGASEVYLAGDFNSWSATDTPMKKGKNGDFSVKLDLETGKSYQFRYLFDGKRWENDWNADSYIPAPFSNTDNSVVNTEVPKARKASSQKKAAAPKKTAAKKSSSKKA